MEAAPTSPGAAVWRSPQALLVGSFAALIALGTVLLALPWAHATGRTLTLGEAAFTATSAVCVTGLVVVDTGSAFSPAGQVAVLLLIQVGGLGIMTFAALAVQFMGRRLSLWRYRREVKPATSYFSFPGESLVTRFLGRPVKEYRSFPAVPPRPGVGVFFGLSGGRLLLTTVYVRGIVDEAQVGRFVDRLKGSL